MQKQAGCAASLSDAWYYARIGPSARTVPHRNQAMQRTESGSLSAIGDWRRPLLRVLPVLASGQPPNASSPRRRSREFKTVGDPQRSPRRQSGSVCGSGSTDVEKHQSANSDLWMVSWDGAQTVSAS